MPHETSLIATIVAGLGLAFVLGALAHRLRLSPLVGYLLAGVAIGPFTPGYVADQGLALQLAEIGVILLMFGVGLHFSVADLMAVRRIAVPGALVQMSIATLLGMGLAAAMGRSLGSGLVFGLCLSVASTVVLLRAMQERRLVETERGRIAVGWLIVEDLAMVLSLVLLPAVSEMLGGSPGKGLAQVSFLGEGVVAVLLVTLGKVAAFVALMLLIGRRIIPAVLHWVAHSGSRELFRLAVLAIALGVAFGSALLFDVSFALGAFFAGMILAGSELSHQAAKDTLPLRDAFAVLFFVSVGMLFDPSILVEAPLEVLATVLIIVVGKSAAAYLTVRAFGHPSATAFTISASLAQIGEFSFILAGLGVTLGLLSPEDRDLVLAGAILSILINPILFAASDRRALRAALLDAPPRPEDPPGTASPEPEERTRRTGLVEHTVLVGFGRVGSHVGTALRDLGVPLLVVEEGRAAVEGLRKEGVEVLEGRPGDHGMLEAAALDKARHLVSVIPDPFEAGSLIEAAKRMNPDILVVARAHSDAEVAHLKSCGADHIVTDGAAVADAVASIFNREIPLRPEETGDRASRRHEETTSGLSSPPGSDAPMRAQ